MTNLKSLCPESFFKIFSIIIALVAIPVIGSFRHGSFLIPLLFILGPFFFPQCLKIHIQGFSKILKSPSFCTLGLFLILCLISTFWSVLPQQTFVYSLQFAGVFITFAWLFAITPFYSPHSQKLLNALIIAFFAASFLILMGNFNLFNIRNITGLHYRGLKPNVELLSVLAIPLGFYIYQQFKPIMVIPFTLFTLFMTYVLDIRASMYGLIIGLLSLVFWYVKPRLAFWLSSIALMVYTLALPFFFKNFDVTSYFETLAKGDGSSFLHRLITWKFAAIKTFQKFWLGWGAMSSKNFPEPEYVHVIDGHDPWPTIPSHTHNIFVQVWLELGFVGSAVFLSFIIALAYTISKNTNQLQRTALGVLFASTIPMLSLSHSLWHTWWTTWIGFCGFICIILKEKRF